MQVNRTTNPFRSRHQYVDRRTGSVCTERLAADRAVHVLYASEREQPNILLSAVTSLRFSRLLGNLRYDLYLGNRRTCGPRMLRALGADLDECLDDPASLDTPRKVFERRIRYWETRPLSDQRGVVVSPCDARMLLGSFRLDSALFLKDKFFTLEELLGGSDRPWSARFRGGDYAIFRLTPDRYHYNHVPAAGQVIDIYAIDGACHSCNPYALVRMAGLHAKNLRIVTVIETDVEGGSQHGLVAMVEIAALMIGDIVQCYSDERYETPRPVKTGMFLRQGAPKSLFRPGSSTVVLLFEPRRVLFDEDLLLNQNRSDVQSRFSAGLGCPRVETDVVVRSQIGRGVPPCCLIRPACEIEPLFS